MSIGDKIFSYIDIGADLTLEMVEQYRNSLIFLGDEQQIFQPLTGAYVGIGMTYFNEVKEEILKNTEMLMNLDEHIHQNVVNSLWAEYSKEEFDSVFTDASIVQKWIAGGYRNYGEGVALMTNQDIVVKGLHDYDKDTGKIKTTDDIGWTIDDENHPNINNTLWKHITRDRYSAGSTGIQVNVHHTGEYKTGEDEYGFTYSYWQGQDYITIDDHLTWSYIASQSSYLMMFSKRMAVDQANRVYHDILGGNEPVYIEKSFDEIFDINNYGDLVPIIDPEDGGDVYIHVKNNTDDPLDTGKYELVQIYNDDETGYYYVYYKTTDKNTGDPLFYILKTNDTTLTDGATVNATREVKDMSGNITTENIVLRKPSTTLLVSLLHPDDGYDKNTDGSFKEVAWYHIDADATAQGQMNLADGIQTLKEVSYILDQITNGDDSGISLTYNIYQNAIDIQNIKNWQENIGDFVPTSIEGTTNSSFVLINSYSADNWNNLDKPAKGDAKLDIDLNLARTYMVNGNSYAAYLNIPSHTNYIANHWVSLGDTTNENFYYNPSIMSPSELTEFRDSLLEVYGSNTTIPIWTKYGTKTDMTGGTYPDFGQTPSTWLNDINDFDTHTWLANEYILFNYKLVEPVINNGIVDGLTTVGWVTTYFKWAQVDIFNEVNRLDEEVKQWVLTYINSMNYTDTEPAGQFVSKVEQHNGVITVTHKMLPLDTILASQEVYGSDFFVEISSDQANEIVGTTNPDYTKVFVLNEATNTFIHPTIINPGVKHYIIGNATRFTNINLTNLNASDGPQQITNDLLLNRGNLTYFRRIDGYKVDAGLSTPGDMMKYIPVDINELLTASNTTFIDRDILKDIYYYNGISNPISKYLDVTYRQNKETGATEMHVSSYVTYLGSATKSNTGLADAYDVRHTIEMMFTWVNLKNNKIIDDNHPLTSI